MDKEDIKREYDEVVAKMEEMGEDAADEMREKRDELKAKLDEMGD
jgi:uncharacterized coiled-coil DUF342 family protein